LPKFQFLNPLGYIFLPQPTKSPFSSNHKFYELKRRLEHNDIETSDKEFIQMYEKTVQLKIGASE